MILSYICQPPKRAFHNQEVETQLIGKEEEIILSYHPKWQPRTVQSWQLWAKGRERERAHPLLRRNHSPFSHLKTHSGENSKKCNLCDFGRKGSPTSEDETLPFSAHCSHLNWVWWHLWICAQNENSQCLKQELEMHIAPRISLTVF